MKITVIELDKEELAVILGNDADTEIVLADRIARLDEEKPEVDKPSKPKKTEKDNRIDIAKCSDNPTVSPDWITCNGYEEAATKIGCHLMSVIQALRLGKETHKGWYIKWHVPRDNQ